MTADVATVLKFCYDCPSSSVKAPERFTLRVRLCHDPIMKPKHLFRLLSPLFGILMAANSLPAQGTSFTYQGSLSDGGSPANGNYDLQFTIYDAATNGSFASVAITNLATGVNNGLFALNLDFGSGVFNGPARWLEIGVRTNGSSGSFAILSPRQALLPAPYAITAAAISGPLPASQLTGALSSPQLGGVYTGAVVFSNVANRFTGDAGGVTNLQAAGLTGAVQIANGGTGQTTAGAARTNLGVAGITDNNTYTGVNTYSLWQLLGGGSRGGMYWTNDANGPLMLSPQDANFNFFIGAQHGGAGNGVEWQLLVNQMYFGPVNGGHFQFGLGSDVGGDALVMQYAGLNPSAYTRSHALGWHLKYALGDLFWHSWGETYGPAGVNTSGASVLHFTLPILGGNQDWSQVGTISGLTLDSDTGVEIPGYTRVGYLESVPFSTNCAINLTNQQFQEFNLNQAAYFYETNLNLYGHFKNPVALTETLLIRSVAGGAEPVTFPTNWIWFNDNGTAVAPASVPAATVMRVDLTITVGATTNRLAHYTLGH